VSIDRIRHGRAANAACTPGLARQDVVVHVAALAAQQAQVLDPRHRLADPYSPMFPACQMLKASILSVMPDRRKIDPLTESGRSLRHSAGSPGADEAAAPAC